MKRWYLDNAATTPLAHEVREAMLPWLDAGNPSSLYREGRAAKAAIDEARERVAARVGCLFAEVIFTSGGTEAANFAVVGAALANENPRRRRILISAAEHHCTLETAAVLNRLGYRVELLPVDHLGRVLIDQIPFGDDVLLVAAMHANNELGTFNDISEIGRRARESGALYFCDAVQTFMKHPVSLDGLDADLIAVSSHKIHGPKGIGALIVRAGTKLKPLIHGGGQEREMRGGTENVAAIVGLGEAVRREPKPGSVASREAFLSGIDAVRTIPAVVPSLAGHAHVRIPGKIAETALIRLDRAGISASSGAACSSGSTEPSHVMLAAGFSVAEAREGLRFTLPTDMTETEAREAGRAVAAALG